MPRGYTYRPDHDGMAELASSKDMGDAMLAAADRGASWARQHSPVESGGYAAGFSTRRADVDVNTRYGVQTRAGAILENTTDYAAAVEHQYGHHVLARAVDEIERGQ